MTGGSLTWLPGPQDGSLALNVLQAPTRTTHGSYWVKPCCFPANGNDGAGLRCIVMKFGNGVEISAIANTTQNIGTPFTNSIKADYEVSRRPLPFFMGEWRTERNLLPSVNTALTTLMKTLTQKGPGCGAPD